MFAMANLERPAASFGQCMCRPVRATGLLTCAVNSTNLRQGLWLGGRDFSLHCDFVGWKTRWKQSRPVHSLRVASVLQCVRNAIAGRVFGGDSKLPTSAVSASGDGTPGCGRRGAGARSLHLPATGLRIAVPWSMTLGYCGRCLQAGTRFSDW
jgi:hypothetical protein